MSLIMTQTFFHALLSNFTKKSNYKEYFEKMNAYFISKYVVKKIITAHIVDKNDLISMLKTHIFIKVLLPKCTLEGTDFLCSYIVQKKVKYLHLSCGFEVNFAILSIYGSVSNKKFQKM